MRHILLFAILAYAATASYAQMKSDTIVSLNKVDSVTIVSTQNSLSVKVDGKRCGDNRYVYDYDATIDSSSSSVWDITLPFTKSQGSKRRASRFSLGFFEGTYIGASLPVDDCSGMQAGWEMGINNLAGIYYRPWQSGFAVSLGLGLGYQSANVGGGWYLGCDRQILTVRPNDEAYDEASSRLHLLRVHVPLLLTQHICSDFVVQVGGILNLNAYMKATTKIKADGVTYKNSFEALHQRFATVDLFASVQVWDATGVYVRYAPMQVFDNGYGPRYDTVSFGLFIGF